MKAIQPYHENDNIVTQVVSTSDISDKMTEEQKDVIVQAWNWSNSKSDVMKAAEKSGIPKDVALKAYRELNELGNWANHAGGANSFGVAGIFPLLGIVLLVSGICWLTWEALVWCGFIGHVASAVKPNMPLFCTATKCIWINW